MKSDLSLDSVKSGFGKFGSFLFVHDKMIYFVLFVCALIGAIISLNLALYQPSDEEYRAKRLSETQSPRFDTQTIDKIKDLNAKQQTYTEPVEPGKRTNPFGE